MEHDLIFMRRNSGLPRIKNIPAGACNYTSNVISIDNHGRIFACLCEAWLPWSVGHVMDFDSIDDIFQHPIRQEITASQDRGEYAYCDTGNCGVEKSVRRLRTIQIYVGIDDSCQLSCPSCRLEPIFDKDFDEKLPWVQRIMAWIEKYNALGLIEILIGSHGDPFASKLYRLLMARLSAVEAPVRFQLRSNGLLLTRYLHELEILPRLTQLEISIDAASAETYEKVRKPAKWQTLLDNLEFCQEVKSKYKQFRMQGNFVIQADNFREIPEFIDLCSKYQMTPNFTMLQNWNTFSFKDNAVHFARHPLHAEFLAIMKDQKVINTVGSKLDHWTKS